MISIQLTKSDIEAISHAIELVDPSKENEFIQFFNKLYYLGKKSYYSIIGQEFPLDAEEYKKFLSNLSRITYSDLNEHQEFLLPAIESAQEEITVSQGPNTQVLVDGKLDTKQTNAFVKALMQLKAKSYIARVDQGIAAINQRKKEIALLEDSSSVTGAQLLEEVNSKLKFPSNLFPYSPERLIKEKLNENNTELKKQEDLLNHAFKTHADLLGSIKKPFSLTLLVKQFRDTYASIPSDSILFNNQRLKLTKLVTACHRIMDTNESPKRKSEQLKAIIAPLGKINEEALGTAKICEHLADKNKANTVSIYLTLLLCTTIPLAFFLPPVGTILAGIAAAIIGVALIATLAIRLTMKDIVYSEHLEKETALYETISDISESLSSLTLSSSKEQAPTHYSQLFTATKGPKVEASNEETLEEQVDTGLSL